MHKQYNEDDWLAQSMIDKHTDKYDAVIVKCKGITNINNTDSVRFVIMTTSN